MAVIKIRPQEKFTSLDNSILQDKNLSLEAIGLWAHCMSRPKDWTFHVSQLCSHFKVGKDKVNKIINELIDEGYAFKGQTMKEKEGGRSGKRKTFSGVEYIFFGEKIAQEEKQALEKEYCRTDFKINFQQSCFQDTEIQGPENPPLQNKESSSYGEDIDKGKTNTKEPDKPAKCVITFDHVKMKSEAYEKLCKDFGKDVVDNKIREMNEYAEEKPRNFREYGNHSLTVRKWIKKDLEKSKNEFKSDKTGINDSQKENLRLNHELVNELKLDYPDRCGTMTIYFKEHILKCKDPYFDISMLVAHKDFCRFLGKQFKMNIFEVRFPNG
jgi:hypothetical protein